MKSLKALIFALGMIVFSAPVLAQSDLSEDDAYDPFADYSEFEASADEEADIHFFKNGRFFNLAFMLGGRQFTQELGELYSTNASYGLNITYFFDIRTAIQISYTHSEHKMRLPSGVGPDGPYEGFAGNVNLSAFAFHLKYYFNTANITRGFADLNPYLIGGAGINYRTINVQGEDAVAKSNPFSFDVGAGIEIPIARKKFYVGAQALYHYVTFPDESADLNTQDGRTGIFPRGDYMSLFMTLGINF